MGRLYLNERLLKQLGMDEATVSTLRKLTEFVEAQEAIAAAEALIATQGDAIDAANTDITAANSAINALDVRIDAYDALAPFVRQNQAARPAHTPFAGVTASNPPTQAEVQAISDALASQSTTIAGLLSATDTVNLLT